MHHTSSLKELKTGCAVSVSIRKTSLLRVTQGRLWVTRTGDPRDYFVFAGQSLELDPGQVVLEADSAGNAGYLIQRTVSAIFVPKAVAIGGQRT